MVSQRNLKKVQKPLSLEEIKKMEDHSLVTKRSQQRVLYLEILKSQKQSLKFLLQAIQNQLQLLKSSQTLLSKILEATLSLEVRQRTLSSKDLLAIQASKKYQPVEVALS